MEHIQNVQIPSGSENPIVADIYIPQVALSKPLVIFNHGFKGFKDWGYWHILAKSFAEAGYIFIKFNQSHNGMSPDDLLNFSRLDDFGKNTYSQELHDLKTVTDWVFDNHFIPYSSINKERISLMGHSRGGSTAIIYGNEDDRIKKVVTWASFNDIEKRLMLPYYDNWDNLETVYIPNSRTGQQMPQHISIYHDYKDNKDRLNIKRAFQQYEKPIMLMHGTEDNTVHFNETIELKGLNTSSDLYIVPNGNHVFGGYHPYTDVVLPEYAEFAFQRTLKFLAE